MRLGPTTRLIALATLLTSCCAFAFGQSCVPGWDTAVGSPGISTGASSSYIGALLAFDDGSGERLYAAGDFPSVAGTPGTSLIARWDRGGQSWSSVGGGLSGGFVTSIVPFDAGGGPDLVVGGAFVGAPGVPATENLAMWNGSAWSSLNAGLAGSVWSMTTWDDGGGDKLYVGGRFPTAGGVTANGIAAWDGVQWQSLGVGITGSFNPYVGAMMVFDDGSGEKLYVGGRFDTMNGLGTQLIARWDGAMWEQVGSGLINDSSFFGLESMAVYDDGTGPALYVGGRHFHAPGQPVGNVAKWDGQQWTTVGAQQSGRVTTLCTFDDGNGPGLYLGGNALPNLAYFARLLSGQWQTIGGGIANDPAPPWPSVFALHAWHGALYVGGNYNRAGGQFPCGGIAAWGCPAASAEVYGTGCDNLTLTASGLPTIGNAAFALDVNNVSIPVAFVGFGTTVIDPGLDLTGIGMAGCFAYTSLDIGLLGTGPVVGGIGTFPFPIPGTVSLAGALFSAQGVAPSAATALMLAASNGVELVVGF